MVSFFVFLKESFTLCYDFVSFTFETPEVEMTPQFLFLTAQNKEVYRQEKCRHLQFGPS